MPEAVRCDDPAPHYFHDHQKIVVRECSGKTSCGLYQHPEHSYDSLERLWCPGICDCGMRGRELHGPGEHK